MLDILQHIQALDPSQHGAVGYLVQHTLEHIQHKKHAVAPEIKRRSAPEHLEVQYSVGLVMKHKRWITLEKRKGTRWGGGWGVKGVQRVERQQERRQDEEEEEKQA